jgi:hypothetical protein
MAAYVNLRWQYSEMEATSLPGIMSLATIFERYLVGKRGRLGEERKLGASIANDKKT